MTKEERKKSLVMARRACLMLTEFSIGKHEAIILNSDHREEISSLIEEFARLDKKERKQQRAGKKDGHLGAQYGHLGAVHGIKGGRPKKGAKKTAKSKA
jgi:hypothetical protein